MGRPPTTGRYATREELVIFVWNWYDMGLKQEQIARVCKVSTPVVAKILNKPRP